MAGATMRAVRLFEPGDLRCVEIAVPRVERPDEVLLKVMSCGVCGSDIPRVMEKGAHRHPITIGHEFAGQIVETGTAVPGFRSGDRVTVMPLVPCGKCEYCRVGDYVLCDDYGYYGSRIEGAMAEYALVSAPNLLRLPENVDFESGSMTDPAAIALHAVRRLTILPGQSALVFGLGAIGFFALQWLRILGCRRVFVVDIFEEKLALARRLGAEEAINGKEQDVPDSVERRTGGAGVDLVIELVGSPVTQRQALQVAAKRGQVVYCGISYKTLSIPFAELNRILRRELTIRGAWNSSIAPLPVNEWQTCLQYMSAGLLKTESLVTHRYRLEECRECFGMLHARTEPFIKVMFGPQEKG